MGFESIHKEAFRGHKEWAEKYVDEPSDWARRFGDTNISLSNRDLNYYAYYRCYPMRDQDIAIVGTNPRLAPDVDDHPIFDFKNYTGDFHAIRDRSVETMKSYFTDPSNPRSQWLGVNADNKTESKNGGVLRPIATETEYLPEDEYTDSEFYEDDFYDSIYYTNLFKFGSSEFSDLPDSNDASEIGAPYLEKELDHINPKVVIMLGQTYRKLSDGSNITDIHGSHGSFAGCDVIPHIHPSGYQGANIKDYHYDKYRETLQDLL
jgi:hypothetical protein